MGVLPKDHLRTESDGLALISEPSQRIVRLRGGFGDELIADMFRPAGIEAALSDKGRYTDRLIRHMGGLQKCRAFKIPGVRSLIAETINNAAITAPYATQRIRGAVGQVTDLDRFSDLVLRAGQKHPLTSALVWDYLLRKRVFLPGAELKCEECSLNFWLSIDDLRSVVTCTYCAAQLVVGPLLKSNLDWKYRRSPLLSVDASLHGSLPVLLTLQQIHTLFPLDIIAWSASMDLLLSDGTRCETDLAVVTAHTFHPSCLVIGECKTTLEFNGNDLRNLRNVASCFNHTGIDIYIVFSKLAKFTDAELTLIRALSPGLRDKVILFDVDALEPYDAFQEAKNAVINMEGLARASAAAHAY